MALTIGANTVIFSLVNAMLIRPLPFASPASLVQVAEKNDSLNITQFAAIRPQSAINNERLYRPAPPITDESY